LLANERNWALRQSFELSRERRPPGKIRAERWEYGK